MAINPVAQYQQVLSMALEDRAAGYQDLVSNSNALLAVLKSKGLFKEYSGPRIRETLQIAKPAGQWYNGYDFLDNSPLELFNDAYWTPKMVAVPITLSYEEILNNEGTNEIMNVMESYIGAAERSMQDTMDIAVQSDGTANNGKQLTGLKTAVPTVVNSGTYGGIDRGTYSIWRTSTFDANSAFSAIGTQVSSTTIRPMLNSIMTQRARGKRAADLLLMSTEHYAAYDAATVSIQRVQDGGSVVGKLGFTSLKYYGAGRTADIVLDGGIGTNMPSNTTYGIETDSLRIRYNPNRNFQKLFEGEGMKPINQDAVVQYIGFMGELTMVNPLFTWKFYDSNPAA
jgi:hypothetical protein